MVELENYLINKDETTNVYNKYTKGVKKRTKVLIEIIGNGRTISGVSQETDVPVDIYKNNVVQKPGGH